MAKKSRSVERCVAAAAELGLRLEVRRFPEGTRTAADAARAVGCEVGAIAKSIVLWSDEGAVLVLTSGANRVDPAKVAAVLGVEGVRRADADEVRAVTGYAIGGTAPFGHPQSLPILCDADLKGYDRVWAAAGTPDAVFPIAPDDLLAATGATVADVREGLSSKP